MNSVPRAVPGSLTTLQKLWRVAAVAGYSAIRAARAQWHIFRSHDEGHTMVPHPTFACQVVGAARAHARRESLRTYPTVNKTILYSESYPSTVIEVPNGIPVEVTLIAKLGLGMGNQVFMDTVARQLVHRTYEDAFGEESAVLGATRIHGDDADGPDDVTALYTFSVSSKGHPFHRHEGHRCFTAVSGSSGCRLGFSHATPAEVERDPLAFVEKLAFVEVPPDALFTVRFNGSVYHQFSSVCPPDPAFVAISVHTDETGGDLDPETLAKVESGDHSIGLLTMLAPQAARDLADDPAHLKNVPLTVLSFDML